jgi:hypothetical protein
MEGKIIVDHGQTMSMEVVFRKYQTLHMVRTIQVNSLHVLLIIPGISRQVNSNDRLSLGITYESSPSPKRKRPSMRIINDIPL